MKKRRTLLATFLICSVLCIGIGFATLTNVLEISGTAYVNLTESEDDFNSSIYFSTATDDTVCSNSADGDTASVSGTNQDRATFTVRSLNVKDDEATFTFTIQSTYEKEATLTATVTVADAVKDLFTVTTNWTDNTATIAAGNDSTPAETTIIVTVKMKDNPTTALNNASLVTLDITATVD